jgi:hypothetical protein
MPIKVLLAALASTLLLLSACTPAGADQPSRGSTVHAEKTGDGKLHHELEPLTSRVPAMSEVTAATWTSGTLGSNRAPGPSVYWIDVVAELPQSVADELRATLTTTTTADPPSLAAPLTAEVPQGEWLVGSDLDAHFSSGGWSSRVHLQADGTTVVVEITGT